MLRKLLNFKVEGAPISRWLFLFFFPLIFAIPFSMQWDVIWNNLPFRAPGSLNPMSVYDWFGFFVFLSITKLTIHAFLCPLKPKQ